MSPVEPSHFPPALRVGDALTWAWRRIADNPGPLIVGPLVWGLFTGGVQVSVNNLALLDDALDTDNVEAFGIFALLGPVIGLLGLVLFLIGPVAVAHMSLVAAAGNRVSWRDLVTFPNVVSMAVAVLVTTALEGIGLIFLIVPGAVLAFLWYFTLLVGVERGCGPFEAMGASWRIIWDNANDLLLFALTGVGLWILGVITLVGWVITIPLVTLMTVYGYVVATGRAVAG